MMTLKTAQRWLVKLGGALLATAMVAGLALAPAYAAAPAGETPGRAQTLETLYQREQNWLSVQTNRLTEANTIAAKLQNWINTLTSEGKDTTALAAALATFNGKVATAQTNHDTAAGLLAAHAGFDDNGAVTDRTQAAATVRQAHQALQTAHLTLVGAAVDLRLAVRTWRAAQS